MNGRQMTPLIETILSLVRKSCDPRAPGWPDRLADEIWQALYTPTRPFEATSGRMDVIDRRLVAVEVATSSSRELAAVSQVEHPSQ